MKRGGRSAGGRAVYVTDFFLPLATRAFLLGRTEKDKKMWEYKG